MTPGSFPRAHGKVSDSPYHPSLLSNLHEMTGKDRRRGVRVRIICLVGSAVFVMRGDLPLSQVLGRLQRISNREGSLREGEIGMLFPSQLSFSNLPLDLAE